MFDTEDRKTGERGGSLLSLGRAIEDERARAAPWSQPAAAAHPDAVTRHQLARSKRESRPSPILEGLADTGDSATRIAAPAESTAPTPPRAVDEPSLIERLWRRG